MKLAYKYAGDGLVCGRSPLLPITVAEFLIGPEGGDEFIRKQYANDFRLRSAIYVSSPDLYRELIPWLRGKAISDKAVRKLSHFLNRMASRCTPFGLFATIGIVAVGDRVDLEMSPTLRVRVRPDVSWIRAVKAKVESDPMYRADLPLAVNEFALSIGERVYLSNAIAPSREQDRTSSDHSIRRLPAVEALLEGARSGLTRRAAIEKLIGEFGADAASSERLLDSLESIGLLVPSVPISPLREPVRDLLSALPSGQALSHETQAIADGLQRFATVRRASNYRRIVRRMSAVAPAGRLHVQVDASRSYIGELPKRVMDDAAELASYLGYVAPKISLTKYREAFANKYGFGSRPVPLLEVVDPNFGIGAPPDQDDVTVRDTDPTQISARYGLAVRALRTRTDEIDITNRNPRTILGEPYPSSELPRNLEFCFQIAAESQEAIERGAYLIVPSGAHALSGVGRTVARFVDVFDEREREKVQRAFDREREECSEGTMYELAYLPDDDAAANVLMRPWAQGPTIAAGSAHPGALSLRDILVNIEGERFAFWSARDGSRIQIRERHAVNTPRFGNPATRFLALANHDGMRMIGTFMWEDAEALPVLPRIVMGRLVLSLQRWNVPRQMFTQSRDKALEALRLFVDLWGVHKAVYAGHFDRMILARTDSREGLDALYALGREISGSHDLVLEEVLPRTDQTWLRCDGKPHRIEFFASLDRVEPAPAVRLQRHRSVDDRRRPSDWTYVRLYVGQGFADRLLTDEIAPFAAALETSGVCREWFFVRYRDAIDYGNHLRVRFRAAEGAIDDLRLAVLRFAEERQMAQTIEKYAYEPYERELERYGGPDVFDDIESMFGWDSRLAVDALLNYSGPDERIAITLASANLIASGLLETPDRLTRHYVELSSAPYKLSAKERDIVKTAAEFSNHLRLDPDIARITERIRTRALAGRLTESLGAITHSMWHMHMNRFGVTRGDEETLDKMAWHLFKRLSHMRAETRV